MTMPWHLLNNSNDYTKIPSNTVTAFSQISSCKVWSSTASADGQNLTMPANTSPASDLSVDMPFGIEVVS